MTTIFCIEQPNMGKNLLEI